MSINVDEVILDREFELLRGLFHELRYCSEDQADLVYALKSARRDLENEFRPRALPF